MVGVRDNQGLRGIVTCKVFDAEKNLIQTSVNHNLIVTDGKGTTVTLMGSGLSGTKWSALAIGTDATPPLAGNTTLGAEITTGGGSRGAATVSQQMTTVTGDTLRFVKSWLFSGGFAVSEVGIFNNNSSGGNLLGRALIGPLNVVSGNTLQITYDVVLS